MYAERGFNDKINHVIATALLEIEIANGSHNQPQDAANDKAVNHWIVECQKWCGCTHRVCSVLESWPWQRDLAQPALARQSVNPS